MTIKTKIENKGLVNFESSDMSEPLLYVSGTLRTNVLSASSINLDTYNITNLVITNLTTSNAVVTNLVSSSRATIDYLTASVAVVSNTLTASVIVGPVDSQFNEKYLEIDSTNLYLGNQTQPNHVYIGEAQKISNLLCFSSSSTGTWTDYTSNINSIGSSFSFPGTGSNNALYFAINSVKSNGNPQRIYGMDISLVNTASYGTGSYIEWETWNGSSWAHVSSMATEHNNSYRDINTGSFDLYTSQSIRFSQNTMAAAVTRSLTTLGISSFSSSSQIWLRARITGALNALPSIDWVKAYSNTANFGEDAFLVFHGSARPLETFPWNILTAQKNFTTIPADQVLGIGDNISVGFLQNQFNDTADKQIGFSCGLPLQLDTSTQPTIRLSFAGDASNAGNAIFTIRYSYTLDGDPIYVSLAAAPTVAKRERTTIVTASGPFTSGLQKTISIPLDFEGFPLKQQGTGSSPVLWITFERTGTATADTYTGNINLLDITGRYLAWAVGSHVSLYT